VGRTVPRLSSLDWQGARMSKKKDKKKDKKKKKGKKKGKKK
jgi:hypothetical protein